MWEIIQPGCGQKLFLLILLGILHLPKMAQAQQSLPDYEAVSIHLVAQRVGDTEIPALINGNTSYLSIVDLFNFLRIENRTDSATSALKGSFIDEKAKFTIDATQNTIRYKDHVFQLTRDELIKTSGGLFLRTDYFEKIFELTCIFNFNDLSIVLSTTLELPILREIRQDLLRNAAERAKEIAAADTVIGISRKVAQLTTVDYSINKNTSTLKSYNSLRIGLGLGGSLAGGETTVMLNYYDKEGFDERQQFYLWRRVDNEATIVKQLAVGKIHTPTISSFFAPLIGIQATNTPTTLRRSFGTYALSNTTEPFYTVELYVNGALTGYAKADAAGLYAFDVPLTFGNMDIKLRFYAPNGMEDILEKHITLPFNFLPAREFQYSASSGIVSDISNARFFRFAGNYGISTNFSIGGGLEYLSSIKSGQYIPFLNTSAHLFRNFLITAEYAHGVRAKALLSYNLSSGLQIELDNNWYHEGQTAINNNFLADHKFSLSIPFRTRTIAGYSRISLNQLTLKSVKYTTLNWMLSATKGIFSASANTYVLRLQNNTGFANSNVSLSIRLPKNTLLTQQLQYDLTLEKPISIKTLIEGRISSRAYLYASFEKNLIIDNKIMEIGFKYDFAFLQSSSAIRKSDEAVTYLQSFNGSLIGDLKTKSLDFSNHTAVGKGALLLIPFLDFNGDGKRNTDEPLATGLKAKVNGGRIRYNKQDGNVRVIDLEGYEQYTIELESTDFERAAWKLSKKIYQITATPNQVMKIDVPILVVSEVSGQVSIIENDEEKPIGRLIINFYNTKGVVVAHTLSEIDGSYTYTGLLPGSYTVGMDKAQLHKLGMISTTLLYPITIKNEAAGSVVENVSFKLKRTTN